VRPDVSDPKGVPANEGGEGIVSGHSWGALWWEAAVQIRDIIWRVWAWMYNFMEGGSATFRIRKATPGDEEIVLALFARRMSSESFIRPNPLTDTCAP
jgi:hypothetical protein